MNATDVRSELGTRLDHPMLVAGMPLIVRGRLAWAHDFVNNPSLGAVFQSLPGSGFGFFARPIRKIQRWRLPERSCYWRPIGR